MDAYAEFLQGKFHFVRDTEVDTRKAVEHFELAHAEPVPLAKLANENAPGPPANSPVPTTQGQLQEPAAFFTGSGENTVDDMIALGTGRGAEALHGSIDTTQLFEIVRDDL